MGKIEQIVQVRVKVVEPPRGVSFSLQEGEKGLVPPSATEGNNLLFDFTLKVADLHTIPVRFTGPFAQGPASGRFVYICSGSRAGQIGSCWSRRAKVPLSSLTEEMVARAMVEGKILEGDIQGVAKDGGPTCASVKLLNGWHLV